MKIRSMDKFVHAADSLCADSFYSCPEIARQKPSPLFSVIFSGQGSFARTSSTLMLSRNKSPSARIMLRTIKISSACTS